MAEGITRRRFIKAAAIGAASVASLGMATHPVASKQPDTIPKSTSLSLTPFEILHAKGEGLCKDKVHKWKKGICPMRKRVFVNSTLVVIFAVISIWINPIELFTQVNIDVGIDAIQAAHRVSGFNRFLDKMDIEIKAERIKVQKGDRLFPPLGGLHERMYGKSVWKVSYNGLRIHDARWNRESTIPGYDVFLDAETGIPFKIVSHWPPSINEKQKKDVRVYQQVVPLELISPELPQEPPTFTLGQLMEKAPARFVSPYYVEAYYVLNSPPNRDPVWMFVYYSYGRPAPYADSKNPNAYCMLHDLYIYNARTGKEGWYIKGITPRGFER